MRYGYIFGLGICLWAVAAAAQTYRRTNRGPNFFMPANAVASHQRGEKLPPVEMMRYQGEQAPIVVELQQRAQAQAAAEKQKQQEHEQSAAPATPAPTATAAATPPVAAIKKTPPTPEPATVEAVAPTALPEAKPAEVVTATAPIVVPQQPKKPQQPIIKIAKRTATKPQQPAENTVTENTVVAAPPAPPPAEKQTAKPAATPPATAATPAPQEDVFAQIITDYQQDLEKIRRGEDYQNPRLNSVLADFTDTAHRL